MCYRSHWSDVNRLKRSSKKNAYDYLVVITWWCSLLFFCVPEVKSMRTELLYKPALTPSATQAWDLCNSLRLVKKMWDGSRRISKTQEFISNKLCDYKPEYYQFNTLSNNVPCSEVQFMFRIFLSNWNISSPFPIWMETRGWRTRCAASLCTVLSFSHSSPRGSPPPWAL